MRILKFFKPHSKRISINAIRQFCTEKVSEKAQPKPEAKDAAPSKCKPLQNTSVSVAILNAKHPVGCLAAFLLKQNPLVSNVHLCGCSSLRILKNDLDVTDTRCQVHTHEMPAGLERAVRGADIIIILPNSVPSTQSEHTIGDLVMFEGPKLYKLAEKCIQFAPKAVTVVAVSPVTISTIIVSMAYKKSLWYHPGRVVGFPGVAEMKAAAILAENFDLSPESVYVPIVGGPDLDVAVPLFSKATPVGVTKEKHLHQYVAHFHCQFDTKSERGKEIIMKATGEEDMTAFRTPRWYKVHATALNRMITTIALGILGDDYANSSAFVRSNVLCGVDYLMNIVQWGRNGVVHNYGLPIMHHFELLLFDSILTKIQHRHQMAQELVNYMENNEPKDNPPEFILREKRRKSQLELSCYKS